MSSRRFRQRHQAVHVRSLEDQVAQHALEPVVPVATWFLAPRHDPDALGLEEQIHGIADRPLLDLSADQVDAIPRQSGMVAVLRGDAGVQAVRRADEAGDEPGRRTVIDLELGPDLLDPALPA